MSHMKIPLEMRRAYLSRRSTEFSVLLSQCQIADSVDWQKVKTMGHQVKGSAESFLFPELTPLADLLEEAGRRQDPRLLQSVATQLTTKTHELIAALALLPMDEVDND